MREMIQAGHEAPQHSSYQRISVCVDDYGLHAGVNAAVLDLVGQGRVQAVSAMVGAPAWQQGAGALRACDPSQVDVGLHLDFTEHALQPEMRFALSRLIARAYLGKLDEDALRTEIVAQLDAFEQAMGRAPAYVDGHQHVHQLPMLRTLLLAELQRRYTKGGLWLRCTRSPRYRAHADAATAFKARVIATLGSAALARDARAQGLLQNAHLLGVYGFTGTQADYLARLALWLAAAKDGDLLMCHTSAAHDGPDALTGARQNEYAVLRGAAFAELLERWHLRLAPMSRILGLPSAA
jgi:predicted glycoside hydrolase/deacetylase ChbG (UPF0249 family)